MNIRTATLLPTLLVLLLPALELGAQVRHIAVGKAPAVVLADAQRNRIHVLTAGVDSDFDGELEPTDVPPAWYVIDATTERVVDSTVFDDFFNSFPVRVAADWNASRLYVPQKDRIRAFNTETLALERDTVTLGNYSGVSIEPTSGALILHMRPSTTEPGTVIGIHPTTGDTIAMGETGINPQMSVTVMDLELGTPVLYTLNEGTFGSNNSTISYVANNPDIYATLNGGRVGGGASQIVVRGDVAYVLLGGTHQLRLIDPATHGDLPGSPIDTRTAGFDGPRALDFQGDSLVLVATYASDLRRFRIVDGTLVDSIPLPGRGESVVVRDSLAFVAIKYAKGTYDVDSLIAVVNLNLGRVVDSLEVGPDPAALFLDKRGDLHVIGYGTGGVANWQVFDRSLARRTRTLVGELGFPLRVAYDTATDSLFIVLSDSLFAFSAATPSAPGRTIYTDATASGDLVGVSLAGNNLLVIELPKDFDPTPGYLHVVEKGNGHRIGKFRAGVFLTMAAPIEPAHEGATAYYILSEGAFGGANSSLGYVEFAQDMFRGVKLGSGGNHLYNAGDIMIATMNGSHELVGFSATDWSSVDRLPVGTTLGDGPRETVILNDNYAATSTWSGDVRVIGEDVAKTIETGGKAEGMAFLGTKLFVANIFETGGFVPASTVAVIDLVTLSIERESAVASATSLGQNFPNPAVSQTTVRFAVAEPGDVEIALYSARGERVGTLLSKSMEPGSYTVTIATDGLPSGDYLYTLRSGSTRLSRTMKVVR